ncbi:hypothetical protein RJ639_037176 [Escallonia herrerae]|uniref:FAD-binding PCMH-type domain-containing protein n=1 Tax=Escallonia herrerae TaxID=1293975 RepID=A0AA89B7B6_9ASTE|nr:hypothetical protein RJ639_037176 [Escallonia herrerae]
MGGNLASILLIFVSVSLVSCYSRPEDFLQCMSELTASKSSVHLFNPSSKEYANLFNVSQQNTRWMNSTSSTNPVFIFTPSEESEIQAAVVCAKRHRLEVRAKSGGHDYEGLSFRSQNPFVMVDLVNFRAINVDINNETAWVQAGATLGEVYYNIAKKSGVHAFPGGVCPSVGVGGHISGGGFGLLLRKYGLAADNVVDARIIDVNGRVLDRNAMGEDLFWAIRGGGGASFSVITAWKIKLVRVPPTTTVFKVTRRLNESATKIFHKWQLIGSTLPEEVFIQVMATVDRSNGGFFKTIFSSLFLGKKSELLPLMNARFPELGLQETDCQEMPWIKAQLHFAGANSTEALLNRVTPNRNSYKAKSDYVKDPIPESGLEGIWKRFLEGSDHKMYMIMDPYGGKMDEISESALPFPHRKGNLYNVQYLLQWYNNDPAKANGHMAWLRDHYSYMEQFVSRSPRAAYLNYKDLDLGMNAQKNGSTSFSEAKVWGERYFKGNFERLARVKGLVDPEDFFGNEQSIPPLLI